MQNSINLVGTVVEATSNDELCFFKLSAIRPYKENNGCFKEDVFECRGYKTALDSMNKDPEVGKKVAISGSLFIDELGKYYIDVYQLDII